MLKRYLIVSYGILVKAGRWNLEPVEGEDKPLVPEEYVIPVAEYLATQQDIDATVGNVHQLRTSKIASGEYSNIVPVALKDAVLGDLNAMGLYGYGNPIVMEQENQGG